MAIALCAFAMWFAVTVLRYGLSEAGAEAATARQKLAPFIDDPAVGYLARANLLSLAETEDPVARIAALRDLLALTPLASGVWLDLAQARLENGEPSKKVVSALVLSQLTGPNEGQLMAGRAALALPLWAILPPPARNGAVADLLGGWRYVKEPERQALRAMFSVARQETREAARAALLRRAAPTIAKELGLEPLGPAPLGPEPLASTRRRRPRGRAQDQPRRDQPRRDPPRRDPPRRSQ